MLAHGRLIVPRFTETITTGRDLQFKILQVVAPWQREALLIKLPQWFQITLPCCRLGTQIQLGKPAPAHRAEGVPMKPDVLR